MFQNPALYTSKIHLLILFDVDKPSEDIRDFLVKCDIKREDFGEQNANTSNNIFQVAAEAKKQSDMANTLNPIVLKQIIPFTWINKTLTYLMNEYNFLNLSAFEFENLSRDILQEKTGHFFESFTSEQDSGIDLRASDCEDEEIIVQAKR